MKIIALITFVFVFTACKGVSPLQVVHKSYKIENHICTCSDTVFVGEKESFSLILMSQYSKDTLNVIDYKEDSYSSPIVLRQFVLFTSDGKILKKYQLPIKTKKRKTIQNVSANMLQTPIYKIGVIGSNIGFLYMVMGSDYCNGIDCPEFLGIYDTKGNEIFEGVTNHNNKKLRRILNLYKININKWEASKELFKGV